MTRAILSCNGLDKPEGSVAREVAIRAAAATGGEIICPVLLNRGCTLQEGTQRERCDRC